MLPFPPLEDFKQQILSDARGFEVNDAGRLDLGPSLNIHNGKFGLKPD